MRGIWTLPPAPTGRPRKPDEHVNYDDAHYRVRQARGRASTHTCSCGAQAEHRAFQHASDAQIDGVGRSFSLSVDDYEAMCRSCHNKLDHEHGRRKEQLDAAREKMMNNASA